MLNNPTEIRSIRKLPISLSNQIAAGEVVERPASILKELIENSIDAGAHHIRIEIEQAGLEKITVTDDGCGIAADELGLAVSPHATSKIYSQEQLGRINTLGFRGEALASIASVSKFEIISRTAADDTAWKLDYSNNNHAEFHEFDIDTLTLMPVTHPVGTSVSANKIFYNTPARKKYLRTERTEFIHVEKIIKQLVLSNFNSSFVFKHNGREVYRFQQALDEATKSRRILKVCGKSFYQNSVTLNFEASGMSLHGWLTTANYSRASADLQFFYINGRIIRDRVIFHAIRLAFKDTIPEGRYIAYVLYLTINTQEIDVNVHPTKHEVRFNDLRLVHDFLSHVISQAINSTTNKKSDLPYDTDSGTNKLATLNTIVSEPVVDYQVKTQAGKKTEIESNTKPKVFFGSILRIVEQRFLLVEFKSAIAVIELTVAQSFVMLYKLRQQYQDNNIISKPLLIPNVISLEQYQIDILESNLTLFNKVGIDFTVSGIDCIMLRSIPVVLDKTNFLKLFKKLSEYFVKQTHPDISDLISVLCHTDTIAIANDNVSAATLLLSELNKLDHSLLKSVNCKCWHSINIEDLEKLFIEK